VLTVFVRVVVEPVSTHIVPFMTIIMLIVLRTYTVYISSLILVCFKDQLHG
jgi:hypothetical protein